MMNGRIQTAPEPTLRRLPAYLRTIQQLADGGQATQVSCTYIAASLGLDPTSVRKDLAVTGIVGRPRVGYPIRDLIDAIQGFLGWNSTSDAFLVGAGSLGRAILGYRKFQDYGLNVVAAFDNDPDKVGLAVHGKQVLPLEKLPDLAARMQVHIGIITVPAEQAASVASLMVLSGIEAIWNFAPARLEVPQGVILEHVELSASLASLSSKLAERRRNSLERTQQ